MATRGVVRDANAENGNRVVAKGAREQKSITQVRTYAPKSRKTRQNLVFPRKYR